MSLLNKNKNKLEELLKVMVKYNKKTNDSKEDGKINTTENKIKILPLIKEESLETNDLYKILMEKREKKDIYVKDSKISNYQRRTKLSHLKINFKRD